MNTEENTETWLTTKQIKARYRAEFEQNYESFYPVETMANYGFERRHCPKCGHYFWASPERKNETCGDSSCEGKYSFIRPESKDLPENERATLRSAWDSFKDVFLHTEPAHTNIRRYPVVARWRDDVDFVNAGIFCFQPHCVSGETEPPANPLVCSQPCLRFNDLDSIGLSGRHFSCFNMIGIQVFNTPENHVYWMNEVVRFNLQWIIDRLGISSERITLIEDVWAGGGNLGTCVEYFIDGLEVGNMVFMAFRTSPDGYQRFDLPLKVIDTGIGLERIPWLLNGSYTSYMDTFRRAIMSTIDMMKEFKESDDSVKIITHDDLVSDIWRDFGPYSCLLNVDECDSMEEAWKIITDNINKERNLRGEDLSTIADVKRSIGDVRDFYVMLDHLRAVYISACDGCLASSSGGGSNIRTVLRRVFHILRSHGWDKIFVPSTPSGITVKPLMKIFEAHRNDLEDIDDQNAPTFVAPKSLEDHILREYDTWTTSRDKSTSIINTVVKQIKKTQKVKPNDSSWVLPVSEWIKLIQSHGIDADTIADITGFSIPETLYAEMAEMAEKTARSVAQELYNVSELPETIVTAQSVFQLDEQDDASVVAVLHNEKEKSRPRNVVAFNKSCFYPTSGGQDHDTGFVTFSDIPGKEFEVIDCYKAKNVVLHVLNCVPENLSVGSKVTMKINLARRKQLTQHHSAAHVVCAAAREVLGGHIWQAGAKKTETEAHLDLTHYKAITDDDLALIEARCNEIVAQGIPVHKFNATKDAAEKAYGHILYQGGAVAGNDIRIVRIGEDDSSIFDVEACCGCHVDSTGEIGMIRLVKSFSVGSARRVVFVAGAAAVAFTQKQTGVLNDLMRSWDVELEKVVSTGNRFFTGYKRYEAQARSLAREVVELKGQMVVSGEKEYTRLICSCESGDARTFSSVGRYVESYQTFKSGICLLGKDSAYILMGQPEGEALPAKESEASNLQKRLQEIMTAEEANSGAKVIVRNRVQMKLSKKQVIKANNVTEVTFFALSPRQLSSLKKYLVDNHEFKEC